MAYDLLLRGGQVVDGSGGPSFTGDVGVVDGKIVETGRLGGSARRVIDVQSQVIAPGFIDNHCHFDAQALWDPLCTFACYHGTTTVINGNCSLGLAPARVEDRYALLSMLCQVEAIPLASLQAGVEWSWETIPEYLDTLDRRLGVNVGALIGFSAVRRYIMGDAAYTDHATDEQIAQMKEIIRDGIRAGALGVSFERNVAHVDIEGRLLPANIASSEEVLATAEALTEVGAGSIQFGGVDADETRNRLARATGRPVVCNLGGMNEQPEGAQIYPSISPFVDNPTRWTLITAGVFDALPAWRKVISSSPEEEKQAFRDPVVREKLRAEANGPDRGAPKAGSACGGT